MAGRNKDKAGIAQQFFQERQLIQHAKKHSKEHMRVMRREMNKGMSFEKAHKIALQEAGK